MVEKEILIMEQNCKTLEQNIDWADKACELICSIVYIDEDDLYKITQKDKNNIKSCLLRYGARNVLVVAYILGGNKKYTNKDRFQKFNGTCYNMFA